MQPCMKEWSLKHDFLRSGFAARLTFLPLLLSVSLASVASEREILEQYAAGMKAILDRTKTAARVHDFTPVISRAPVVESLVYWNSCDSSNGRRLVVNKLISRLSDLSQNRTITVSNYVLTRLGALTVETRGWGGKAPYVYFVFSNVGNIRRLWLVYDCEQRSNDFDGFDTARADAGESDEHKKLAASESPLRELRQVVQNRDFSVLRSFIPQMRTYLWGPCGEGDMPGVELSFEDFVRTLSEASRSTEIYFKPDFIISRPDSILARHDSDALLVSDVHSVGWVGEYRYLSLRFIYHKSTGRWGLTDVCDSVGPPLILNKDDKFEHVKFDYIPPVSPIGPSSFADPYSLRWHLIEIVKGKQFDTLRRFAPRGMVIFGECERSLQAVKVNGKPTTIEDVTSFLKESISSGSTFKYSSVTGEHSLEVDGWSEKFPHIAFWFTEEAQRWEWTKLSYCQSLHTPLLFQGPR